MTWSFASPDGRDGSVRIIRNEIDLNALGYMVHRFDGQTVNFD